MSDSGSPPASPDGIEQVRRAIEDLLGTAPGSRAPMRPIGEDVVEVVGRYLREIRERGHLLPDITVIPPTEEDIRLGQIRFEAPPPPYPDEQITFTVNRGNSDVRRTWERDPERPGLVLRMEPPDRVPDTLRRVYVLREQLSPIQQNALALHADCTPIVRENEDGSPWYLLDLDGAADPQAQGPAPFHVVTVPTLDGGSRYRIEPRPAPEFDCPMFEAVLSGNWGAASSPDVSFTLECARFAPSIAGGTQGREETAAILDSWAQLGRVSPVVRVVPPKRVRNHGIPFGPPAPPKPRRRAIRI